MEGLEVKGEAPGWSLRKRRILCLMLPVKEGGGFEGLAIRECGVGLQDRGLRVLGRGWASRSRFYSFVVRGFGVQSSRVPGLGVRD